MKKFNYTKLRPLYLFGLSLIFLTFTLKPQAQTDPYSMHWVNQANCSSYDYGSADTASVNYRSFSLGPETV